MEENRKKESFLARLQKLPEPVRRMILWGVMGLLVLFALLVMGERVKQSARTLEGVEKEEMFGEPEKLEELQERQSEAQKGLDMIQETREEIEELEKERERIINENLDREEQ